MKTEIVKGCGLDWKKNKEEVVERRRRFFTRQMKDGILASLPVKTDTNEEWAAFEKKWGKYKEAEVRPFPQNEEIFDRSIIGLNKRGGAEDDWLPVVYSAWDADGVTTGLFGKEIKLYHRERTAGYCNSTPVLADYSELSNVGFSDDNFWIKKILSIQEYFEKRAGGLFGHMPTLACDALNFASEIRGPEQAYVDMYENPEGLNKLMEVGKNFCIWLIESQMKEIKTLYGGFCTYPVQWTPFPRVITLSIDAYVVCSVKNYVEFGFDFQSELIKHFGNAVMHFHCNRADLAVEVAKLPGLRAVQYGGDTRDKLSEMDRLPEMKKALGDIPIYTCCGLKEFIKRLKDNTLISNVWYAVSADDVEERLSVDEANRLMETVRNYRI